MGRPKKTDAEELNLKASVYLKMMDKLISCEYMPGSVLNEAQLTEEYGVSRTPIREAIGRLESQGYLKVMPKKGILVNDITMQDVQEVFQIRILLEPIVMTLAAPNISVTELMDLRDKYYVKQPDYPSYFHIDMEMHHLFADRCGNHYLTELMNRVLNDNLRIAIAGRRDARLVRDANQEHIEILESLIRQDSPEKSAELLREHILIRRKAALEYLRTVRQRKEHQSAE